MMASPRKRFFSGEMSSSSQELPITTNTAPLNDRFGSNGNLRLMPGRSLSSSAALLRQRYSNSPPSPTKRTFSGDLDGFIKTSYGYQPAPPSSPHKWILQGLAVLLFLALCLVTLALHESNMELQHTITMRDHEIDHHIGHAEALEHKVNKLKSQTFQLSQQVEALEERPAVGMTELQRKLFHMEHYQNLVHQGIQTSARRMVREKFGPGPYYYIELKLDLPGGDNTIFLETAHLDLMPHSIHLFLEQVSHGLYDNTAFHRNAAHIVQAGPSNNPAAHEVFRQHPSLNSVLFQEYNPNFPHYRYTLGYAGRPGGPDFYINLRDNSELHGHSEHSPSYDGIIKEADPCFARIVDGVDVVERLHKQPVGWQDAMTEPVSIERMRVITAEEYQRLPRTENQSAY